MHDYYYFVSMLFIFQYPLFIASSSFRNTADAHQNAIWFCTEKHQSLDYVVMLSRCCFHRASKLLYIADGNMSAVMTPFFDIISCQHLIIYYIGNISHFINYFWAMYYQFLFHGNLPRALEINRFSWINANSPTYIRCKYLISLCFHYFWYLAFQNIWYAANVFN